MVLQACLNGDRESGVPRAPEELGAEAAACVAAGAGDATGRLYALSTAGGLVGNFAAALALIPLVGTTWTFILAAALLAGVCLPKAWSSKPA